MYCYSHTVYDNSFAIKPSDFRIKTGSYSIIPRVLSIYKPLNLEWWLAQNQIDTHKARVMFSSSTLKFFVLTIACHYAMAVNTPKPDDAAAASCTNWSIIPNTASLAATCSASDGSQHSTSIAFSECVGNQDGNIACQLKSVSQSALDKFIDADKFVTCFNSGGAGSSCILSNLQAGQNFLTVNAMCKNRAGQEVQINNFNLSKSLARKSDCKADKDIDACLTNFQGNLGC